MPQFGVSGSFAGSGINGNFSTYFQHVLMDHARGMSTNPHMPPGFFIIILIFKSFRSSNFT
jgi:hypothetical protein